MCDAWDDWLGSLSLAGVDPRGWDLNRLLAAFEAQLRQSAKDEQSWLRTQAALSAEPREVREERRAAARSGRMPPAATGMTVDSAEAMIARFAAADAMYR